jgi:hypothetical protein
MNGVGIAGGGYTGTGYTGDVLVFGNLLVTGGIDPTYLALTPQASGPAGFINPLWVDSVNQNALRSVNILIDNTATAKTSLVVDNAVVGANATLTQSNLTINATGLSGLPSLTLNQSGVGSGLLTEEFYNQRTAQIGEFNRMSFYAKSSTGVKTEYARIHQNAPVMTTGSVRGRLDFGVQQGSGIVDYLILNGQAGSVGLGATLDCNSNSIQECNNIQTPSNNNYSKEYPIQYLTANTSTPTGGSLENNLRYVAFSLGKTPTWEQATSVTTSGFVSGVENITASIPSWDGQFWVGTEIGNIYYSSDGGASWTLQGSYGGRIRVFCPYQSNT